MVTTNILNALALLHEAGVRVHLLNEYNPAYITEKADVKKQPLQFVADDYYLTLPKYEISSAANLNLPFVLIGHAHDHVHNKDYPAKVYKTVTIVKNQKLFKDALDIHPDDVEKCIDLGFDVTDDNKLDLTKFSLTEGLDNYDDISFARSLLREELYQACRARTPRKAKPVVEYTEEEKWLRDNGLFDGVYSYKVVNTVERVHNQYFDATKGMIKFDDRSHLPRIDAINEHVNKKKTLTEVEQKVANVYKNANNTIERQIEELNTIKYARQMLGIRHVVVVDVELFGEHFNVSIC